LNDGASETPGNAASAPSGPGQNQQPPEVKTPSGAKLDAVSSRATVRAATSPQLNALCERAASGAVEDVKRLAKWASLVETEAQMLRRRLRKQQHDFVTLFEIVGQTSARSLDVVAMQTYLLRTVSGHFAAPKLLVMRRQRAEDSVLSCSAVQGIHHPQTNIPIDSPLSQFALERGFCFPLDALPETSNGSPEVMMLKNLDIALVVPLIQEIDASGAVLEGFLFLGKRLANLPYAEEDLEFLNVLGKMFAICLRNEALYRRSVIDDLTGVASRGHFDAQLSQELNRILTYGHRSMGLVMLDVDNFKSFNDTYGHQTGDRVLQELSRVLVHQVRNVDLVARYGGEEFAIILLEIDRPKVLEVAERLRKAVEEMEVTSSQGQKLRITASFGLACFPDDATEKSNLIQLADEALYRSKYGGRNCVTMTEPGSGLNRAVIVGPANSAPSTGQAKSLTRSVSRTGSNLAVMGGIAAEIEQLQRQQRELALGDGDFPTPEPMRIAPDRRRGSFWSREERSGGAT
jgi:diguanylate cyclase (GGDEF)-like protein